ncbi:DUF397 domain-containing protein [Streptomyces durmitorensis]|uniref:DUF397 domain-containing protein n=1 Tax=Streptomyces durmitorensis TaxID=319947 RepID=A0ABY4PYL4_9ACTN|nr:DUF397 domain-containing protein [Streptomyces durmitorensis]UQT58334.1 DUF397 domain-containing protein [Streptomyces durmitorensis]
MTPATGSRATGSSSPFLTVRWRKSSYSNGSGGECVEVAAAEHAVLVRDSKRPDGSLIAVRPHTWSEFLATLNRASSR